MTCHISLFDSIAHSHPIANPLLFPHVRSNHYRFAFVLWSSRGPLVSIVATALLHNIRIRTYLPLWPLGGWEGYQVCAEHVNGAIFKNENVSLLLVSRTCIPKVWSSYKLKFQADLGDGGLDCLDSEPAPFESQDARDAQWLRLRHDQVLDMKSKLHRSVQSCLLQCLGQLAGIYLACI